MDPSATARELAAELRVSADAGRAAREKRYLKSALDHLGVPVPEIRACAKRFARSNPDVSQSDILRVVSALWKQPVHELRMLTVELLIEFAPALQAVDIDLVERLIRESKTWALVDTLAVDVAGDLADRHPRVGRALDRWAADEDFWVRRAAMLALLRPLRRGEGDFDRFARYADTMLEEREFFVRKAIGWILREASKKRPALVFDWLAPRAARASGVTVREAVKYLPAAQRDAIMRAHESVPRSAPRRPSSGTRRPAR